ncbi:ankyrin repeat domain-containing protein 26 [Aplochiton taeniatus]
MKKIFNFTKKKRASNTANTSDTGSGLSVGYELKDKDLGKVHKAALVGDLSKLRQHVKKNDINQLDKENRTALHIACANGHAEVVQFLAESKAKLNLCDNQNRSALMKAVQCQHDHCLVPLLEHNADPNLVDINGNTALHLATDIPSMSIAMLLLEHDANINSRNKEGFTPLTISVMGNHVEMAELLLKEGADVNTKDHGLRTPLMMSACSGNISMVRLLLQHNAEITLKDTNGWSSDDYAVMNGNHACSHLIIEHETKRNTIPSTSHNVLRKKKKDCIMGSPSQGVDASFSLGGPATNKDDPEDISQTESISRASKRVDDDWPSSDEDEELDLSPKKPQKLNLKKIIAAKKVLDGPDRYWSGVESEHDCKDIVPRTSNLPKALLPSKAPKHPIAPSPDSFSKAPQTASIPLLNSRKEKYSSEDDEEQNEDIRENIEYQAEMEENCPIIAAHKLPERQISQDKERDFLSELGLEKGDNEDSWDSEFSSGSPKKQHGVTLNPEIKKETCSALEESQQAVENDDDEHQIDDHDGGDSNGHIPIDKPGEMKKEPLSFCNQFESAKEDADKNTGAESSDWDTASTSSKGTGSGRRVQELQEDSASSGRRVQELQEDSTPSGCRVQELQEDSTPSGRRVQELQEDSTPSGRRVQELQEDSTPSGHRVQELQKDSTPSGRRVQELQEDSTPSGRRVQKLQKDSTPSGHRVQELQEDSTPSGHRVQELQEDSTPFPVPLPKDSPSVELSASKLDDNSEKKTNPAETSKDLQPLTLCSFPASGHLLPQPCVREILPTRPDSEDHLPLFELSSGAPERESSPEPESAGETAMAEDFDELTQSTDTASEDIDSPTAGYRHASLLFKQLDPSTLDSINMVKLQNMFHEYERTIQKERNRHGRLTEKLRCMELVKGELHSNLEDIKDYKSALEHQQLELQTDINNLKFQLKQEQQKHRNASMMYDNTKEQLKRKEEQHCLEAEEKQKLELSRRNLELEMRALVNNMKQLEEDHSETQRLLTQERSSRALQENLLTSHLRKQQDIEEENRRNMNKSSEVLSQLTEASGRERELLQQIAILQEDLSCQKTDLELSRSHWQQEESRLTEEIKTLKERFEDNRRDLKLNEEALAQTVFQYNGQLATLKTEHAMVTTRLEHERQIREQLELEVGSGRTRLAGALQEAELCQAARAEAEKALHRKTEEIHRIQDKCTGEVASQRESISGLSQKLSKMEERANSLENEVHRTHLQLAEKSLLLETKQQEKDRSSSRLMELETTLLAERAQTSGVGARREATQERLAQAQSEAMLLRQQLEEAQNRAVAKENAVIDAQKRFSDILAQLRLDCEDRVQLVEERSKELAGNAADLREQVYKLEAEKNSRETELRQLQQELADSLKKLSMSEASLEVNTHYRSDLEEEKGHLLKDIDKLKAKREESEDAYVQMERRINALKISQDDKEQELTTTNQKLKGALSDIAGLNITIKQLEEAVQRLEIENARLEAAGKHQSNTIAALQKAGEEAASMEMEKKRAKKTLEQRKSVDLRLDQEMKRNIELQKEMYRLRSLVKTTKKKLKEKDGAGAELASSLSRGEKGGYGHNEAAIGRMKDKVDELQGQLEKEAAHCSQMKRINAQLNERLTAKRGLSRSNERLEKSKKQLEDDVSNLRRQIESGLLDQSQAEQYRQHAEERARKEIQQKLEEVNIFLQTQAASQEALDQIKAKNETSLRSQLEQRIQELEQELVRARSSQHENLSQHNSTRTELERYRDLYNEELRLRKALAAKLERSNERLTETNGKLLNERHRSKSLISSSIANGSMGVPLLEIGTIGSTALGPNNRSLGFGSPLCNPTTEGQATAELEEGYSSRMSPVGSVSGSPKNLRVELDPISRATQQYLDVLKKNYMI